MREKDDSPPPSPAAMNAVGEATLEAFAASEGYNRFIWETLRRLSPPRGRVLEVGCGIGSLTRLILEDERVTAVHGIDMDPSYIERIRLAVDDPRVTVSATPVEGFRPPEHPEASDASYDFVVSSNVLEHIEDDEAAMAEVRRLLRPGGEALILVPAHPWLYCDIDRNLDHYRRYTPGDLRRLEQASGLELVRYRRFNPLGVLGWWLNGKVLRRSILPAGQVSLYSRFAIPVSKILDRVNVLPLGISLLARYRRPAA